MGTFFYMSISKVMHQPAMGSNLKNQNNAMHFSSVFLFHHLQCKWKPWINNLYLLPRQEPHCLKRIR
jgi:hypothetical protein